jgi:hypothetical protein
MTCAAPTTEALIFDWWIKARLNTATPMRKGHNPNVTYPLDDLEGSE